MDRLESFLRAGQINAAAIQYGFSALRTNEAHTTRELDLLIHDYIIDHGGEPAFLGYNEYPASTCICVNNHVVHALPNDLPLKETDLVTIDVGTRVDEWCVDSADTQYVYVDWSPDSLPSLNRALLDTTIRIIHDGITLHEIAQTCEETAKHLGINIFNQFQGHSIGKTIHENPNIPNTTEGLDAKALFELKKHTLRAGQVICIEPIVTMGSTDCHMLPDNWTVVTRDNSIVSHIEYCLYVTSNGCLILC